MALQNDSLSITNVVFVDALTTATVELILATPVAVNANTVFLVVTIFAI